MPPGVTIVGLGPGQSESWTLEAHRILTGASEVYLRTAHHPSVADIAARTRAFDGWYQESTAFAETHHRLAGEIIRLGQRRAGVIYAVPGHPRVGEATVPHIQALARSHQLSVTIVAGLSPVEAAFSAMGLDVPSQLQIAEVSEIAGYHHPALEPDRPALLTMLNGQQLGLRLKQTLLNAYPDYSRVTLIQAAGTGSERVWSCPLSALDDQPQLSGAMTTVYLAADTSQSSLSALQETIAHLRAPDGCPWDREQTHQSLRPYLIEESYEVLEALDADDPEALAEELGDLLLQIGLHTQIAIDTGEFRLGQVINHINRKLKRRHPHVFGDVVVNGVTEVTTNWEAIKKSEKVARGAANQPVSALDGIPPMLPALAQALTISQRAVRVGFEWPDIEGILEKIIEEAREISEATIPAQLEAEIGDLLFSVVNLARWQQVDPESALRTTNSRFSQRFRKMEGLAASRGADLRRLTLAQMDALWDEVKREESALPGPSPSIPGGPGGEE